MSRDHSDHPSYMLLTLNRGHCSLAVAEVVESSNSAELGSISGARVLDTGAISISSHSGAEINIETPAVAPISRDTCPPYAGKRRPFGSSIATHNADRVRALRMVPI